MKSSSGSTVRRRQAKGRVLVPPDDARFAVVSDIDDTVVYSHVMSKLRMLVTIAFSNAHTRKPFEGVAAFYRALHARPQSVLLRLEEPVEPVCAARRVPRGCRALPEGPLFLRNFGLRMPRDHKCVAIAALLAAYPRLPFILIGDSGESDPEVYRDIVRRHPARIRVDLHPLGQPAPDRLAAIEKLIAEVAKTGCQLVLAPDSEHAAAHAAAEGLIAAAENCAAVRRREKAGPELLTSGLRKRACAIFSASNAAKPLRVDRGAEEMALPLVAAEREQALELRRRSRRLRRRPRCRACRRARRWCARSPGRRRWVSMRAQEQAVDLQLVDRQLAQVGEARVAGAEVVDGEAHAELADAAQRLGVVVEVRHQHALGDLELERGAVQPVRRQRGRSPSARSASPWRELGGRDVDREPGGCSGSSRCQAPACDSARSRVHSPIARIRPQSSASGTKSSGPISPRAGCCQRTSASAPTSAARAAHAPAASAAQLAARQRAAQLVLDAQPLGRARVQRRLEEARSAAPLSFAWYMRGIGVACSSSAKSRPSRG